MLLHDNNKIVELYCEFCRTPARERTAKLAIAHRVYYEGLSEEGRCSSSPSTSFRASASIFSSTSFFTCS